MPGKIFLTILLFSAFFLFAEQRIFAEGLVTVSKEPPFINEIYPSPNTGEVEFIEIFFEGEIDDFSDNFVILNHKSSNPPSSIISKSEDLLTVETGTSFLRNSSGAVFIVRKNDVEIVDSICYGNPPEVNPDDCLTVIDYTPGKGRSLSYFSEIENFLETKPTAGEQNIFINLDFEILDEGANAEVKFKTGEKVIIENKSLIYGVEDAEIEWLLDGAKISSLEIETDDLAPGQHSITAQFLENVITKQFEIIENFEGLKISEVFPNPEGEDESGVNEWIEIHNSSDRTVNTNGLIIQRVTSTQKFTYKYTQDTNLKPGEYFLLYPSFSITNSNCNLELLDPSGDLLDKFSYVSGVGSGESVIKVNNKIEITITPTPGAPNQFTPRIQEEISEEEDGKYFPDNTDFTGLKITEIFPNPVGEDISGENEWLEIFNSSTRTISLKNLVLQKETSRKYLFIFDETVELEPGQYFLLYPTFSLNNSGAKFEIQNEAGKIFDHVEFDVTVKEGKSLIRIENNSNLEISDSPTPGSANISTVLSAEASNPIPVLDVKSLPEKTEIIIKGTVTVEPHLLGKNIFYVQDEGGGIQIYSDEDEELVLGEIVQIHGEIDNFHSEPRINVLENTITKIGQTTVLTPVYTTIGGINPDVDVGRLVTIEGTVMKTSGDTFYVSDGTGELKVVIKDGTGIVRPECRKGYYAKITGILSVWDKDKNGNLNIRLLPRYQNDVHISETLAETGGRNWTVVFLGVGLVVFGMKKVLGRKTSITRRQASGI